RSAVDYYRQPSDDMMWVLKNEWQALMPASPRKGQGGAVPPSLRQRIFKFPLDPARGLGEGDTFTGPDCKREGQLQITVEEVTSREVRLRLEGSANLHNPQRAQEGYQGQSVTKFSQFTVGSAFGHGITYQPRLLGYLAYQPVTKTFTRFD